ncbi:MAG: heptosyltransferase-2 [Chlamydiales bacterium]
MTQILIIKTGALGDVLRTTSVLPGLRERYPDASVTWVTAHAARTLVANHPLVKCVECVDPDSDSELEALATRLGTTEWLRVLSFDDELGLCQLASRLRTPSLSGAYLDDAGERVYSEDVAPWFEMGLLSTRGKEAADRAKVANTRTHPQIFADMLGIPIGRPQLPLRSDEEDFARTFAQAQGWSGERFIVGLNTGAGGRWRTKELPVERTVELVGLLAAQFGEHVSFLTLGGPAEAQRNAEIRAGVHAADSSVHIVDAGADNSIPRFAALVSLCQLLVVSDSLALHIGIARGVRIVTFFAPTSAAEIELFGLGEKVQSTALDYCSYRVDTDNSTLTAERLAAAAARVAALPAPQG